MTESQYKTVRGHEEPFAVQFSVFLANRVGQLRDLMQAFLEKDVDVYGLSIVDSTDWAVVRIVASDANVTRGLLQKHALPFTESEVILVELIERDSLTKICSYLLSAELNVHFAYPLTLRSHEHPVMVFHIDDEVTATQVLTRHGFVLLGSEDLADPEE